MKPDAVSGFHWATRLSCAAACFWGLSCTAHAADATPSYPELLIDDVKHVVTAPARWQTQEWQDLGLATLAVVGTAAVIDSPLRDEMRRHNGNSRLMRDVERFDAQYSLGVLGGFFLAGELCDNDKALAVAQDGLTASIIAAASSPLRSNTPSAAAAPARMPGSTISVRSAAPPRSLPAIPPRPLPWPR